MAWAFCESSAIIIALLSLVVSIMQYSFNLTLNNEQDTQNLAQILAQHFTTGVVYLIGDLGAGRFFERECPRFGPRLGVCRFVLLSETVHVVRGA